MSDETRTSSSEVGMRNDLEVLVGLSGGAGGAGEVMATSSSRRRLSGRARERSSKFGMKSSPCFRKEQLSRRWRRREEVQSKSTDVANAN
jgi:hypothetical protein